MPRRNSNSAVKVGAILELIVPLVGRPRQLLRNLPHIVLMTGVFLGFTQPNWQN